MKTDFDVKAGIEAVTDYLKKDESLKKKGDYYSEDMDEAEERVTQAIWAGSLSADLGLTGHADEETFSKLQDGYLPSGQRMRGNNATGEKILLHDMTLSAPKSVTLHALEDPRLFDAHIAACHKTIAAAEEHYAVYLEGSAQNRCRVLGQGMVAAIIPHWTNRNLEPQLHSHCAIFNGTKRQDGEWRAIDTHPLSRERWMGSYYRNVLAQEVQSLGYKIHETPMGNGAFGFEIDGLTREQIEVFSTRTAEIEVAKAEGLDSNTATLRTRKNKGAQPSWEELRDSTRQALAEIGAQLQQPTVAPVRSGERSATEAVRSAIAHLSERSCRFKKVDIYQRVFDHIESFTLAEVDTAIATYPGLLDYGLIKADKKRNGQLTTVDALERETRTINDWMKGQGKAEAVLTRGEVLIKLDGLDANLNQGQTEAVLGILSSNDQHQILHGLSGVGKTRTLKPFAAIAKSEGVRLKWFAPSLDAAQKLGDEVGAKAETLQCLVYTDYKINRGDMLVIDEGGLASAEMAELLVQKANKAGARILFVGDTGQNRPIDAGTPVISLIEAGATTHNVSEILRQRDKVQRQAVTLASKGNGTDALNLLNQHGYVHEITNRKARANAIADEYLALSPKERTNTLIVAGTHKEKDGIVARIRDGLKAEGALGESAEMIQLRDKGWTKEHALDIRNYQIGDYIAMSRAAEKCPLIKDEFYKVVEIGETLTVESYSGRRFNFNPAKYSDKSVYSARVFDIAVGDEMRWQHTNHKKYRKNGETFKVKEINESFATIEASNGKTRQIPLDAPIAADYTITTTNYRAQGSDRPRVFVAATNDPTSNKEAFYVAISRQIHEIKLWTSTLEGLQSRVALSNEHPNPLKGLKSNDYEKIRYFSTIGGINGSRIIGNVSRNSGNRQSQLSQARQYSTSDFDWDRSQDESQRRKEQNTRSIGGNGRDNERNGLEGYRQWDEIGSAERIASGTEWEVRANAIDSAKDLSYIERLQDRIIELAYQQKMSEVLAEPLQNLTQALVALDLSQDTNRRLLREQAIALAQSKAVAIAIEQWREQPQDRAEEYISWAIDSVEKAIVPMTEHVFWVPQSSEPSDDIRDVHWREFELSCIHPDILALNAESIEGEAVYDRLLSHKLESMGSGQLVTMPQRRLMWKYEGVAEGGWWARGGVDPQDMRKAQEWGTFKADNPRWIDGKAVKYESPLGTSRGIFLAYVPDEIAKAIYKKHGITPDPEKEFWEIVRDKNLPIVITEGAKKTWASLSQGVITIGVSGVNGLYLAKDEQKQKLDRRELNPDIAVFATPGRQITMAFDQDVKEKTIENVRRDLVRGIELLAKAGCKVDIAQWTVDNPVSNADKVGLDDLIARRGVQAYTTALDNAVAPDEAMRAHYLLQYDRLTEQARKNFPRESTEFIDTEVWMKAVAKGDAEDGRRFVSAAAAERGLDPDEYCDHLLSDGHEIRREAITPDPLILDFAHQILDEDGITTRNGGRYFVGDNWTLRSRGGDLSIRSRSGELVYQVRFGQVKNNVELDALHNVCANAVAAERQSVRLRH